jgi:hypothetical protein
VVDVVKYGAEGSFEPFEAARHDAQAMLAPPGITPAQIEDERKRWNNEGSALRERRIEDAYR